MDWGGREWVGGLGGREGRKGVIKRGGGGGCWKNIGKREVMSQGSTGINMRIRS